MAAAPGLAVPFTDIVKCDAQSSTEVGAWHFEGRVVGEPCFVPRLGHASAECGEEDDGWIIAQVVCVGVYACF